MPQIFVWLILDSLTTVQQQVDDNNHEIVSTFTQQMGEFTTPFMKNINNIYVASAT